MSKIFDKSYIRPVYYTAGKVDGKDVYRRAPFDAVVIDGNICVQPRSMGWSDAALTLLGTDNLEDRSLWRQDIGGYETLEPIIIDECQMGDMSDNWMGMTAISNI